MSAPRKPPAGPPPSAGVLAKHARAYARDCGVSEARVRAWISYVILAGLFERSLSGVGGYRYSFKSGVALELRLLRHHERSRATKEIATSSDPTMASLRKLAPDGVVTSLVRRSGIPFSAITADLPLCGFVVQYICTT